MTIVPMKGGEKNWKAMLHAAMNDFPDATGAIVSVVLGNGDIVSRWANIDQAEMAFVAVRMIKRSSED
jgi:hypothetical protein